MEFVGHMPDKTHANAHWPRDGRNTSSLQSLTVQRPWDAFHLYAVEWTADAMTFWFDDQKVGTFDVSRANQPGGSNPFRKPHYLLLNLALGGSWGRDIDDSIFPQSFLVDYVWVYERAR